MSKSHTEDYDAVPYPSYTHAQTHPDRLAVIATLFGMRPAPIDHCRVLELGCSDGGNLVPMAVSLPGTEFVGVERASHPIKRAKELVQGLSLRNTSFLQVDLLDLPADLGRFDYIIAHGIYAWVPEIV